MKNISKNEIIKNLEDSIEKTEEEVLYWKKQHADTIKINGRLHKKIVKLEKLFKDKDHIVDNNYWTTTTFNDVDRKTK